MKLKGIVTMLFIMALVLGNTPILAALPNTDTNQTSGNSLSTDAGGSSSYVDVYYKNMAWTDNNFFTAETANYKYEYELSKGGASAFVIKKSGFPDANVLANATHSFSPAVKIGGKWYKASNLNNLGNNDKAITRQTGKNMWQILLQDIKLADDQGNLLPLTVDQTYYFWNEKFYVVTNWKPTQKLSGIEYAELQTYLNPEVFDTYAVVSDTANNAPTSSVQEIPASGMINNEQLLDSVTLFDSNSTQSHGALTYEVINKAGSDSFLLQKGGYQASDSSDVAMIQRAYDKDKHSGEEATWEAAHGFSTYSQLYVSGTNTADDGIKDTRNELNPLDADHFKVLGSIPYQGSKSLGYDNTTGAYTVEVYLPDIDYFHANPDVHPSTKIEIDNNNQDRRFRLKTQAALITNSKYAVGVTGTVVTLTDENMNPLGIPVQTNTKWDDDSGNVNWTSNNMSYATFDVAANTSKTIWHRSSIQNWGANKPQVGNNSLDIKDYFQRGDLWYEMHVGSAEVYCFGPDTGMPIYDVRAIYPGGNNGTGNESASGADFLQVKDGDNWVSSTRRGPGLRFDSYGPNVAQMSMVSQSTSNEKDFDVKSTTTLIPSTYGTRVFHKLRYEFKSDMNFTDIKNELRLFSINDPRTAASIHNKVDYMNDQNQRVTVPIAHTGKYDVDAMPLSATKPWVSLYDGNSANIGYIVKSINGSINNQSVGMGNLAVSVYSGSGANNPAYLVPNLATNQIKSGDYIELELEVFTYKHGDTPDQGMAAEVDKWPTSLHVITGNETQNFPAHIQAANNEAEFEISGGADFLPITVDGFDSYAEPKLEETKDGGNTWTTVDQSVNIKDFWQTNLDDATGKYSFTYALPADPDITVKHHYRLKLVNPTVPNIDMAAQPRLKNGRAFIEGFYLDQQVTEAKRDFGTNSVDITVKEGTDLTKLSPKITVSDYASIQPAESGTLDFSRPVKYIVTAESGASLTWTVNVHVDEPQILSASLPNQSGFPTINNKNRSLTLYVNQGTDLKKLTPTINVSPNATVTPNTEEEQDFSKGPVTYTVEGDENIPHKWSVSVVETDPNALTTPLNDAISDTDGWKALGGTVSSTVTPASITSQGNSAGMVYMNRMFQNELLDFNYNTDYVNADGAWPNISIRQKDPAGFLFSTGSNDGYIVVFKKSTIELQRFKNGKQTYFFNDTPNKYISSGTHRVQFGAVNSDQGVRLQLYIDGEKVYDYLDSSPDRITSPGYISFGNWDRPATISAVSGIPDLGSPKNINSFQLNEQTGSAVIDKANHTVTIEVKGGTNVAALSPVIAASDGTTISPASGTIEDFTDPVVYKVQATDGTEQDWTITVNKQVPNLAYHRIYKGSPNNGSYYGEVKAFDNDPTTFWAPQGVDNQQLAVNFNYNATFNEVVLTEGTNQAWLKDYKLQVSNDGTAWSDIPGTTVTGAGRHVGKLTKVFRFPSISAKQLRLTIDHAVGGVYVYELAVHNLETPYVISDPIFTDGSGNPSTGLIPGGTVQTSMDISNNTKTELPAAMLVALYDVNNRMIDVQSVQEQLTVGEQKTFTQSIKIPNGGTDYHLKVFVWDSIDNMRAIHAPFLYSPFIPPVTPTTVTPQVPDSNIAMWLKADAGVVKDQNNHVSAWDDQSGQQMNAVQTSTDNQPLWVDNAVNGKPVIRFDGNNDMLKANIMGPMPSYSVAFVLKPDSLSQWNQEIGPGWSKFLFHTSPDGEVFTGTTGDNGQRLEPSDGLGRDTLKVGRWDRFLITMKQKDALNGTLTLYKNGQLLAYKDIQLSADWDVFNIGLTNSNTIHGDLAEMMVYKKALSDEERAHLDAYFDQRYPLTAVN